MEVLGYLDMCRLRRIKKKHMWIYTKCTKIRKEVTAEKTKEMLSSFGIKFKMGSE